MCCIHIFHWVHCSLCSHLQVAKHLLGVSSNVSDYHYFVMAPGEKKLKFVSCPLYLFLPGGGVCAVFIEID